MPKMTPITDEDMQIALSEANRIGGFASYSDDKLLYLKIGFPKERTLIVAMDPVHADYLLRTLLKRLPLPNDSDGSPLRFLNPGTRDQQGLA